MFKTVVVAVDGSQGSERALEVARAIASRESSHLLAVHVTELVGGKGGVYPLAADEDELRAALARQIEHLQAAGIQAEFQVQSDHHGRPAHVIADIADSVGADLIIVGTRGRSPVSEVILGSVPIRLLQIAHRPVLVVPQSSGGR